MGIGLWWSLPLDTSAQQSRKMVLFEIDNNRYKKCNYNKEGELESFQKLVVGSIEEQSDNYRLPVELYSYNAEGELQDSTRTIYTCRPDEQQVLLNVFPFTDYGKGSEIKVNLLDTNAFYPTAPKPGWEMEPIEFALNIDKGLVGFLGGKSNVRIYSRQVVSNDTLQAGQYQINSEVDLGVYVLGIKMKGFGYQVIEIIDKDRGIIRQKFTSDDDGSYFVIRLI
ncbi:hypothetical protein NC796_09875 [Aliifodinibius sp. S!AR15-10]|uniref:hypothetical protein n=1 Tax=Aliifodinibius sp. S!AR15-10 TaxID=2950437 RepID=UPI00285E2462|nr:hypothetical protein [Aliifodinibius sp. S!AR15-10]MDR8391447.1 hypothetical protein [Aliifodinibius sp. S!AR15-10]